MPEVRGGGDGAETVLSYLRGEHGASAVELPTGIFDAKGRQIQEWDGILLSQQVLYLLEAKHSMSIDKLRRVARRVSLFPQKIASSVQQEFRVDYKKVVGVEAGLMTIFIS
jgi:hypothetical protein